MRGFLKDYLEIVVKDFSQVRDCSMALLEVDLKQKDLNVLPGGCS